MGAKFTKKTRTMFFDLEYQVPRNAQSSTYGSLLANPGRENQKILGGSFCLLESTEVNNWPEDVEKIALHNFWIWDYDNDEKKMLEDMLQYFRNSWDVMKGKEDREADLIVCGIGISRFDMPILAYRCNELGVANNADVWELLFTTKQVDLSNIGISYATKNQKKGFKGYWVLYPKTANELCREFGIKSHKPSGKRVWDMYENKEFDGIVKRTEGEVRDTIELYRRMRKRIFSGR